MEFNERQTIKLSDFCFDLAKGLMLAGVSIPAIKPINDAIIIPIIAFIMSMLLLQIGLYLLRDLKHVRHE